MELMEAIAKRRSVRKYDTRPLEKEVIEKLINAAIQAPSAMNIQPWVFGVIQNQDKLKVYSDRIKESLLANMDESSPLMRYKETLSNPDYNVFYDAPALVIIFAKQIGPVPDIDCTLAAENLMLTAADMDLGTCWIGFSYVYFNLPEVKAELGIDTELKAIAPIIVGYPAEPAPVIEKNPPQILFWI